MIDQHFRLSEAELAQFHEQGFLGPFTAFTEEEMAAHRAVIEQRVLKTPSPFAPYPTQARHLDSGTLWALCSAPAVVDRLTCLYGPDLMVWYSNFFDKAPAAPRAEDEIPWHQDMWHWKLEPLMSLSVWLAISPATEENGCVELMPGSHKRRIPTIQNNDARLSSWFGGRVADPAHFDESQKVSMLLRPGQFFIFNEGTLHHSQPNRSKENRLGVSFRVTLPSVKSDRDYPCVMLCGEDKTGINPFAEPPQTDPDPENFTSALFDASAFTMDLPVPGFGWHAPERDGDYWFRWTGPEETSWVELKWIHPGDARVVCEVLHAVAPEVLESLELRVNDYPVVLSWHAEGRMSVIEGQVPAAVLQQTPGRARLSVHVKTTLRNCDLHAGSNDTRWLGLGIAGLRLTAPAADPFVLARPVCTVDEAIVQAVRDLGQTLGDITQKLDRLSQQTSEIAGQQEQIAILVRPVQPADDPLAQAMQRLGQVLGDTTQKLDKLAQQTSEIARRQEQIAQQPHWAIRLARRLLRR